MGITNRLDNNEKYSKPGRYFKTGGIFAGILVAMNKRRVMLILAVIFFTILGLILGWLDNGPR